jgi:hypothetical protein
MILLVVLSLLLLLYACPSHALETNNIVKEDISNKFDGAIKRAEILLNNSTITLSNFQENENFISNRRIGGKKILVYVLCYNNYSCTSGHEEFDEYPW